MKVDELLPNEYILVRAEQRPWVERVAATEVEDTDRQVIHRDFRLFQEQWIHRETDVRYLAVCTYNVWFIDCFTGLLVFASYSSPWSAVALNKMVYWSEQRWRNSVHTRALDLEETEGLVYKMINLLYWRKLQTVDSEHI